MTASRFRQSWIWIVLLALAIAAPWAFYNYHTGRQSGFVVSMLSQMGMMSILALSYNMLLGQAGLFSLCHATFFGIGGYATIHFLNLAGAGSLPLPMELIPLLSGLSGLGLAIVFGYMATKQRATAFAMITLGIGELMVTVGADVPAFLWRRGRRQYQPHDRPQPVRSHLCAGHPGLLSDRWHGRCSRHSRCSS